MHTNVGQLTRQNKSSITFGARDLSFLDIFYLRMLWASRFESLKGSSSHEMQSEGNLPKQCYSLVATLKHAKPIEKVEEIYTLSSGKEWHFGDGGKCFDC
jgi:hypothetical protein